VLLNLAQMPPTASFYDKLKVAAKTDNRARRKLNALENTLRHYHVDDKYAIAEAILRLDIIRARPQPGDDKAKMLYEMHKHFAGQV
jgi:hypothetical protein